MLPAGVPVPEDLRLFSVPENGAASVPERTRRRPARPRGPRRPAPLLLAVDGNGLVHRAFHAVGGPDGEPGEAVERVLARPPKSMELLELLDEMPELLGSLGFSMVVPDALEADDVLGSAAALASRRLVAATLATGDQDAFALVRPTVRVLLMVAGGRLEQVSPSWLRARYGVGPEQYPAFAALRGDSSDCLPGVRGIGAVTAATE